MEYLDKDAIVSASELINSTLTSKDYIKDPLLFPSINWNQLKPGQSHDFEVILTEAIYNNDKNVINIIYALLQSVERQQTKNKQFNKVLNNKDEEIAELKRKNAQLEARLSKVENQMAVVKYENNTLTKSMGHLENQNKLQVQDLNKLKHWCNDIKQKYHIEMKRKKYDITSLKDQLIEKKNLSTTITYGLSEMSRAGSDVSSWPNGFDNNSRLGIDAKIDTMLDGSEEEEIRGNSNIIYNNNPVINNLNDTNLLTPVLQTKYEQIVTDLTSVANNLVKENFKFSKFIHIMNNYYNNFNYNLSFLNNDKIVLSHPSDFINVSQLIEDINNNDNAELQNIEAFEFIINPFLNNIYKNYHYILNLVTRLNDQLDDKDKPDQGEVARLRQELNTVTQNWKDTLQTLDNWKSTRV